MKKQLNEKQVLKKHHISSIWELRKKPTVEIASGFEQMEPEVQKKVLEQFPYFASLVTEIASGYLGTISQSQESNSQSMNAYSRMLESIIDALQDQLCRDDISFEEKEYYIDKMIEVSQYMNQKDTENKNHQLKVFGASALALLVVVGGAIVALGGRTEVRR